MTLEQIDLPPISFHRAAHYTEGRVAKVNAFVNHRMVGTLPGTTAFFGNPKSREVSTHFGIGKVNGKVQIHQYVPLDDTAYGNGNFHESGRWDNWGYPVANINAQTISIEHQDHWGDDKIKGIVLPEIQEASQKLQALLKYGSIAQWKAAGLRFRAESNALIIRREIKAWDADGRHIITHHDIAGDLKPFCWLPWAKDDTGFPRAQYIAGINKWGELLQRPPEVVPPPAGEKIYTQAELDLAKQAAYNQGAIDAELACQASRANDIAEITRLNEILDQIEILSADKPA